MDLSLVIPVYNEEQNIPLLFEAIHKALDEIERSWEVIFVDDGSRDGSLSALKALVEKDPGHVRVVVFRRNFGQTAAIAAGIDHSEGDIIVLLDADMQNDPADIPMLLAKALLASMICPLLSSRSTPSAREFSAEVTREGTTTAGFMSRWVRRMNSRKVKKPLTVMKLIIPASGLRCRPKKSGVFNGAKLTSTTPHFLLPLKIGTWAWVGVEVSPVTPVQYFS